MNCKTVWEDSLIWLLDCLEAHVCLKEETMNVKVLSEYIRGGFSNMNFEDYLTKKILVRDMYLKYNSSDYFEDWISKKISVEGNRIISNMKDDTYYERTAKSDLEIKYTNDFEKEFIGDNINNSQYKLLLTNSGMSAILLALHFCRMLSKEDNIIVQSEMYYEIDPVFRTIFKHIKYEDVEQIYQSILNGEASCFFRIYKMSCIFQYFVFSKNN